MAINQWDRGSTNNGPNCHKKGNRVKGQPRQGKLLTEFSKQKSADLSAYKQMAEKYRKARKYRQEDLAGIVERLQEYIDEHRQTETPITVSGMIRVSGVSKRCWYEMLSGDYDYKLFEYCDLHNIDIHSIDQTTTTVITDEDNNDIMLITYSQALQKAMLAVEEQKEERLYSKGRVGDIFSLKAVHGWQEDNTPQTVNQTLVIASPEEAERAIKMLNSN